LPRPPRPPLFPYTTLFRSDVEQPLAGLQLQQVHQLLSGGDAAAVEMVEGRQGVGRDRRVGAFCRAQRREDALGKAAAAVMLRDRSEEHTSELQSRFDLVCR